MTDLESQEEDAPKRILVFKPMSWLGQIRSHRRDEAWSASLCQTFFTMTMGAQIPVIAEKTLVVCDCRSSSWTLWETISVLVPLIRVSKRLMTGWLINWLTFSSQHIQWKRNRHCGDIDLVVYLANVTGPMPLVLDLLITHDRFGSNSDFNLNGHLHYPNHIDRSLNESVTDKIRKYRSDFNNNPPNATSFIPSGNWPLFWIFRSSDCAFYQWTLPLPPHDSMLTV